jgi:hypothetical protein
MLRGARGQNDREPGVRGAAGLLAKLVDGRGIERIDQRRDLNFEQAGAP